MAAANATALHTHLPAMSAEGQERPEAGTGKTPSKTNFLSTSEDEPSRPCLPFVGRS